MDKGRSNEGEGDGVIDQLRSELTRRAEIDASSPRRANRRLGLPAFAGIGAAGGALIAAGALYVASQVGDDPGDPGGAGDLGTELAAGIRTPAANALEVNYFNGLDQMAASSDYVVVGTVTSVEPGRILKGDPKGEYEPVEGETELEASGGLQFNQATLSVDTPLIGTGLEPGDEIPTEEDPRGGLASGSLPGDHGIYFLQRKIGDAPKYFRLASSQGRFLETSEVSGQGRLLGKSKGGSIASGETRWSQDLEELSFAELVRTVERVAVRVEAGEIKPVPQPLSKGTK